MKPRMIPALTLMLVLVIAGSAARANDRQEIDALYARLKQAFLHKDADAFRALMTSDFTDKEPGRPPMNAQQSLAMMRQEFAATKSVKKMDFQIKKLTVQGKNATATTTFTFVGDIVDQAGQMGTKGKTHTMTMLGSSRDALVKTAKGWRFKGTETLSQKLLVDGKPISPGQTP